MGIVADRFCNERTANAPHANIASGWWASISCASCSMRVGSPLVQRSSKCRLFPSMNPACFKPSIKASAEPVLPRRLHERPLLRQREDVELTLVLPPRPHRPRSPQRSSEQDEDLAAGMARSSIWSARPGGAVALAGKRYSAFKLRQFYLGGLLNGQVSGFLPVQDTSGIHTSLKIRIPDAAAVAQYAACHWKFTELIDRGQPMTNRQGSHLFGAAVE